MTNQRFSSIKFSADDIAKIIRHLNPNKVLGHDKFNKRILKICDKSICKPSTLIFNQCFARDTFPLECEKGYLVPIRKKGNKQCLSNYRPVSHCPKK